MAPWNYRFWYTSEIDGSFSNTTEFPLSDGAEKGQGGNATWSKFLNLFIPELETPLFHPCQVRTYYPVPLLDTPQPCPHLTGADQHSLWFPLRLITQRDGGQGLDSWPSVSSPAQGDSSVTQGLLSPYRSREVDNSAPVGSRLLCHSWYFVISSLDFCEWWLNARPGWSWMCLSCCQAAPGLLVTPSS